MWLRRPARLIWNLFQLSKVLFSNSLNHPVRIPFLRSSSTDFMTVATHEFYYKGINFLTMVAFYEQTAYAGVFWFGDWSVWRSISLSTDKKHMDNADVVEHKHSVALGGRTTISFYLFIISRYELENFNYLSNSLLL